MTAATLPRVDSGDPAVETAGVSIASRAKLPSKHGSFTIVAFRDVEGRDLPHVAIVAGEPGVVPVPVDGAGAPATPDPAAGAGAAVLARVHSSCLTGDVLGSLRCDCGTQLDHALARIGGEGRGVVVYLEQEGRGIGLANKVRAYALQDAGADTVEANERLGFPADLRDFGVAAAIFEALGVRRVRLMTNNPRKVRSLGARGIEVVERVPIVADPTAHNRAYLDTKRRVLGHVLPGP